MFVTCVVAMRLSLTCECVCIAQVDSKFSSFITALPEVSSVSDPTYGPGSILSLGESEISSLTNPTYESGSIGEADTGGDKGEIV